MRKFVAAALVVLQFAASTAHAQMMSCHCRLETSSLTMQASMIAPLAIVAPAIAHSRDLVVREIDLGRIEALPNRVIGETAPTLLLHASLVNSERATATIPLRESLILDSV